LRAFSDASVSPMRGPAGRTSHDRPWKKRSEHLGAVPPGDYKDSVELDIRNALSRVAPEQPTRHL